MCWHGFSEMSGAFIAAVAGLIGVGLGGWIANSSERGKRRHAVVREQLERFYSPMLGMRARVLAKTETRAQISDAAGSAWRELMQDAGSDRRAKIDISREHSPDFEKIIEENNRQLVEEIVPIYRQMVDHFSSHMWLADPSTRAYFGDLVFFVEIWDRWLKGTLPQPVVEKLGHSEEKLRPFYSDLAAKLEALRRKLDE